VAALGALVSIQFLVMNAQWPPAALWSEQHHRGTTTTTTTTWPDFTSGVIVNAADGAIFHHSVQERFAEGSWKRFYPVVKILHHKEVWDAVCMLCPLFVVLCF
jgi:hypothetical protein